MARAASHSRLRHASMLRPETLPHAHHRSLGRLHRRAPPPSRVVAVRAVWGSAKTILGRSYFWHVRLDRWLPSVTALYSHSPHSNYLEDPRQRLLELAELELHFIYVSICTLSTHASALVRTTLNELACASSRFKLVIILRAAARVTHSASAVVNR
jgi:hypothetical protein